MKVMKAGLRKQEQAEQGELDRLYQTIHIMRVNKPWHTKNADRIHKVMVEMGKLVDDYRRNPFFS